MRAEHDAVTGHSRNEEAVERIFTWLGSDWEEWEGSSGLRITYKPSLDGGGSFAADWFVDFFAKRYPLRKFRRAFEWCAGPGFIGLSLLKTGICDELVLADINPEAMECVQRTLAANEGLAKKVKYYVSDNFHAIPSHERFDLVVANPPYAIRGNPRYPHDQRTQDPGWRIHADFFAHVRRYLENDALLCISEFCPLESRPEQDSLPAEYQQWDYRERAPIEDMLPLIRIGGLRLTEVINATGRKAPRARIAHRAPVVELGYADWFWILVIEAARQQECQTEGDHRQAGVPPDRSPLSFSCCPCPSPIKPGP